jgi:uroporphyrinogen decarboxylase
MMRPTQNDLLLRTLRGEEVPRPPVWMMRQAGRYLPDYRKLKEKYSFFERVQTPELAAEITLQPVDQIGVEAAILFSDILVIPQAMGLEVQLIENKGPFLPHPIRRAADLERIHVADPAEKLRYVLDALQLSRQRLDGRVPLIGFAGAPWTILCYMVEGMGSKTFDQAKGFCYSQPVLAGRLLDMITETTIAYLKAQVVAGAQVLQLFDSWAGLLGPEDFDTLSLPYIARIIEAIQGQVPTIVFAKGAWYGLQGMALTGASALGIDWCVSAAMARNLAGQRVVLQGNFDPAKLLSPIAQIRKEVGEMLDQFGPQRYIANLGHGILPNIPVEHARAFVETVKNHRYSRLDRNPVDSKAPEATQKKSATGGSHVV